MDVLSIIMSAAKNKHTVTIQYKDSKGQVSTRVTEPYELRDDSYWGYCHMRGSIRNFKISNILNATEDATTYTPRWPVQIT